MSTTVSLETWRARAEWAEAELRKLHMDVTHAAIEQRDNIQRAEDERRARERAEAEAAALEAARVDSWFNHRLEEAVAGGDRTFGEFLMGDLRRHRENIPAGWPEGVTPEVARAAALVEGEVDETGNIASTALGQLLIRQGVALRRDP